MKVARQVRGFAADENRKSSWRRRFKFLFCDNRKRCPMAEARVCSRLFCGTQAWHAAHQTKFQVPPLTAASVAEMKRRNMRTTECLYQEHVPVKHPERIELCWRRHARGMRCVADQKSLFVVHMFKSVLNVPPVRVIWHLCSHENSGEGIDATPRCDLFENGGTLTASIEAATRRAPPSKRNGDRSTQRVPPIVHPERVRGLFAHLRRRFAYVLARI